MDNPSEHLDKLKPNQRYAVIHRNGLLGETPKTFREISEALGYKTPERARQLYLGGLNGLRNSGIHLTRR